MSILSGSRNTLFSFMLPVPFFQNRAVPLQLIPQLICQKHLFGLDYDVNHAEIIKLL